MPSKSEQEGLVNASPSNREAELEQRLTDALERLDKLESRPYVPTPPGNKLAMARTPGEILAMVKNPGDMAGGSAVWDPMGDYGFNLKFSDDQIVEVVDEKVLEHYRDAKLLGKDERLIGVVMTFTHRHPRSNEPKYRIDFGDALGKNGFMEGQLGVYNG